MEKERFKKVKNICFELEKMKIISSALEGEDGYSSIILIERLENSVGGVLHNAISLDGKFNTEFKKIVDKEIERLEKELEAL